MLPVIPPVAVEAFVTVLPAPTDTAVLPLPTLTSPSLLTALAEPVDSVPLTVVDGFTLMVRPLVAEPLKPSGSLVVQLTVVPEALGRQSASAGVGANTANPVSAVPNIRYCFVLNRLVIFMFTPVYRLT